MATPINVERKKLFAIRNSDGMRLLMESPEKMEILPECPPSFGVQFTLVYDTIRSFRRSEVAVNVSPQVVYQRGDGTKWILAVFEPAAGGKRLPFALFLFQRQALFFPANYFEDKSEILFRELKQFLVSVETIH